MATYLVYSLVTFFTALAGGLLPLFFGKFPENRFKLFAALGAGLLIGMAFVSLIPEAAERAPHSFGLWFLLGFVSLLILERFVMIHACEEDTCHYHTVGVTAFVGLAIHGAIEGCALTSTTFVPNLAPFVLLAILIHKAPTAFALTSILKLAGMKNRNAIYFIIGTALATPLGVLGSYAFLKHSELPELTGILLALSAGTFLYIAACDLLPELHRTGTEKGKRLAAFMVGIGISLLSALEHGHGHVH